MPLLATEHRRRQQRVMRHAAPLRRTTAAAAATLIAAVLLAWSCQPVAAADAAVGNGQGSARGVAQSVRAGGGAPAAAPLPPPPPPPPPPMGVDYELKTDPGVYNPSMVVYRDTAYFVARATRVRHDAAGLKWIVNRALLCAADASDLSKPPRCAAFDPWRGNYTECRWGSESYKVPWEATGVDDTKLFVWPGRGVWAVTGRRPPRPEGGRWCPQPVVWRQFLFQLAREGEDVDVARWAVAPPDAPPGVRWAPESPPVAAAPAAAAAPLAASGPSQPQQSQQQPPQQQQDQRPAPAQAAQALSAQSPLAPLAPRPAPQPGAPPGPARRLLINPWAPPWEYVPGQGGQPLLASEQQLLKIAAELEATGDAARRAARRAALARAHPAVHEHLDSTADRRKAEAARRFATAAAAAAAAAAAKVRRPPPAPAGRPLAPHQLMIGDPLPEAKRGVVRPRLGAAADEDELPGWKEVGRIRMGGVLGETHRSWVHQGLRHRRRRQLQAADGLEQLPTGRKGMAAPDAAATGLEQDSQESSGVHGPVAAAAAARGGARTLQQQPLPADQGGVEALGTWQGGPPGARRRRRRRHRRHQRHRPGDEWGGVYTQHAGGSTVGPPLTAGQADVGPSKQVQQHGQIPPPQQQQQQHQQQQQQPGHPPAPAAAPAAATPPAAGGGWDALWGAPPLVLEISDAREAYGSRHSIYEKNWMPFVSGDATEVFVVHSLAPRQKVYRLHPDGVAELQAPAADVAAAFGGLGVEPERLHGGPPLVLVDADRWRGALQDPELAARAAKGPRRYYLGVLHFWRPTNRKDGRSYHHYLYKAAAEPPFAPLEVSAELALKTHPNYRQVTFAGGLHLQDPPSNGTAAAGRAAPPGSARAPRLLISYGSGDASSRVLVLTLDEVERLFMLGARARGQG